MSESATAEVVPFSDARHGLVRVGVTVLATVWRSALRSGGPMAARDSVRDHARVMAHALIEAFGPRAADYADEFARAVLSEVTR